MVFGLVRKKKEYKVGDEVLPGGKIRYPTSGTGEKVIKVGKAFGRVYLRGLKATGKSLKEEYKKPGGRKVVEAILGLEPKRTIPELKEEIKKRKLQNELRELKKVGSDNTGIKILKSINVPDYFGTFGSPSPNTKKRERKPWEII